MASSPSPPDGVRVLLVDDDRLFTQALMTVFSEDERVEVVGIAENGEEALELATELQPDVILMDLRMPRMDGLEATRRIREIGLPVQILMLTATGSDVGPRDAAAAGATAFLRKERGVEEIRQVFLEVASLAAALSPAR